MFLRLVLSPGENDEMHSYYQTCLPPPLLLFFFSSPSIPALLILFFFFFFFCFCLGGKPPFALLTGLCCKPGSIPWAWSVRDGSLSLSVLAFGAPRNLPLSPSAWSGRKWRGNEQIACFALQPGLPASPPDSQPPLRLPARASLPLGSQRFAIQ